MNLDQKLFFDINNLVGHWSWFDAVGKFFGGDYFLYLFILVVLALCLNKNLRRTVYLAIVSGIVARGIVTEILKRVVARPRPFEVLHVHQLISESGGSFPSGHATAYFAFALAFAGTEYFWPLFVGACIGSLGRVFVGVHYPLDVLGGAIIGAGTTLVLRKLFKKYFTSASPLLSAENKNDPQ